MAIEECRVITLPGVKDVRGTLCWVEEKETVPFDVKRVFYMTDIPEMASRGRHAHKTVHQFIVCLSGSFEVSIDDGIHMMLVKLDRPNVGLYACPMTWCDLHHFSSNAVCLVLASEHYSEDDYIRDYDEFLEMVGK